MSANKKPKKKQPVKRKKPMPGPVTAEIKSEVITSTNSTLDELEVPGEKKLKVAGEGPNTPKPKEVAPTASGATPIYSVIQTANPISALYEYCKKGMAAILLLKLSRWLNRFSLSLYGSEIPRSCLRMCL